MTFILEPMPTVPMTLAQAIARMEGWYLKGDVPNRPQRNNNPGDIEYGELAKQYGGVLETGTPHPRFACFPTAQDGWHCLEALLHGPTYSGLTVEAAINRYAPSNENETNEYIALVSDWCGCSQDAIVQSLQASNG